MLQENQCQIEVNASPARADVKTDLERLWFCRIRLINVAIAMTQHMVKTLLTS